MQHRHEGEEQRHSDSGPVIINFIFFLHCIACLFSAWDLNKNVMFQCNFDTLK